MPKRETRPVQARPTSHMRHTFDPFDRTAHEARVENTHARRYVPDDAQREDREIRNAGRVNRYGFGRE